MTFKKKHLYTLVLVGLIGSASYMVSGLTTPLLHKGAQSQILSKFSVGTQSTGSLFTVKNSANNAVLKILPDNPGEKSLLVHNNSLLLGDIRLGNLDADTVDPLDIGSLFGSSYSDGNWQESLQYPTQKTGTDITAVAPQQSVNVHGDVIFEGLKAADIAAESAQLCVAPNGSLTRCSAPTGYKWVATGFSGCLDDQSAITNTIGSLADYQNPQCLISVGIGGGSIGEPVSTTGSATVGFNSIKDAVAPKKAFADQVTNPWDSLIDAGLEPGDINILCNPPNPLGSGGGYYGKKVQGFECKSLNSCEVVADSFCVDSIGAHPTFEASCSTASGDGTQCAPGCHIGVNNQCYVDITSPVDNDIPSGACSGYKTIYPGDPDWTLPEIGPGQYASPSDSVYFSACHPTNFPTGTWQEKKNACLAASPYCEWN